MTAMAVKESREAIATGLRSAGYVLLQPAAVTVGLELDVEALDELAGSWNRLPRDAYLRDGGQYRARRHSCFQFSPATATLTAVPPRPHWQPTTYNALHGGLLRWFEPIESQVAGSTAFRRLLGGLGALFGELRPVERWYLEAHQFRIDTTGGIGRPTPEGAHRDGVDFVAVVLVRRGAVRGGETRVFEAQGNRGVRFTMEQPWSMLLMDDARVIHETTPIQSEAVAERSGNAAGAAESPAGVRDTLVLTYRAGGFQQPAAAGG
jgi:hypothetical protein